MKLQELNALINIRSYLDMARNNFNIDKKIVHEVNKIVVLLDKHLVDQLTSADFKDIVSFEHVQEVMAEAIKNSNIKTGMKNSVNTAVAMQEGKAVSAT